MPINDEKARQFYIDECVKSAWSVRQLERQINTMYYQRILASKGLSEMKSKQQNLNRNMKNSLKILM